MKFKALIISVITLALVSLIALGGTFALFTDDVNVKTHLKAGTLNVTLTRTNLVSEKLNTQTGFISKIENSDDVDFSKETDKNIFDVNNNTLIVPGSKFVAEMQLSNKSDVAFNYWIEIVCNDKAMDLASQLKITVKADTEYSASLANGLNVGSESSPVGVLAKGQSKTFYVTVEYLNLANNNSSQGESVEFDMIIHAVQATTSA